ncbi:MAG: hypothetical protein R3C05_21300 [Pirellulaceae bacterium]
MQTKNVNENVGEEFTLARALAGARRFASLRHLLRSDQSEIRFDIETVAELRDMLRAVMHVRDWSDDEYDAIFVDDQDPYSIGFDCAQLICRGGSLLGITTVIEFFEAGIADGYENYLDSYGPNVIASTAPKIVDAWLEPICNTEASDAIVSVIVDGLETLAKAQPSVVQTIRPKVVEIFDGFRQWTVHRTTSLMRLLVELRFYEAAESIEEAFSLNRIDCGFMGDWEAVRKRLHVQGKGLPMPKKPVNSIIDLRRNLGICCFSEDALFQIGGIKDEAVQRYLETACDVFARSEEGVAVLSDGDRAFAVKEFLELGIGHCGATTDSMTIANVHEILLEVFPRKVSMELSECDGVIDELVAFWKFCDRVHQLDSAAIIAGEIASLRSEFHAAMGDASKFGMAKSLVTQGKEAGFDMTTEEGCAAFVAAYNASTMQQRMSSQATDWRLDTSAHTSAPIPSNLKRRKKLLAKKRKAAKRKGK